MDFDKLNQNDNRLEKLNTAPMYKAMGLACVKQACTEYRESKEYAEVLRIINFFYSGTYRLMCEIEPDVLIDYLDNPPGATGEWEFLRKPKATAKRLPAWTKCKDADRIWIYKDRARKAYSERRNK